jgi:hypothetical protein
MRGWIGCIISTIFGGVMIAISGAPLEVWNYCRVATPNFVYGCVVFEQLKPWND